jgi:hypothetical protein
MKGQRCNAWDRIQKWAWLSSTVLVYNYGVRQGRFGMGWPMANLICIAMG